MSSATRLRIKPLNLHDPDLPAGDRRPGVQRPEQVVALAELLLGQIVRFQNQVASKDGIDLALQLSTQRSGETVQLEVDPGVIHRNLHSSDSSAVVCQGNRVQDMEHGMVTRESEPSLFV